MRLWRWAMVAVAALEAIVPAAVTGLADAAATPRGAGGWASETSSPRKGPVADPKDAPVARSCGGGVDAALVIVAGELARSLAIEGHLPDAQEIEWRQRRAGNPHVWAKTWGARVGGGASLDRKTLAKDVAKWLGTMGARARCGVASVKTGNDAGSKDAIAVIAVDPVADLAAMPTRAKVGAWIDVDVTLLTPLQGAANVRVVLLPPRGAAKTILSSITATTPAHVTARFALGSSGRHVVQVLADQGAGPRPVIEADVWAGIDPPIDAPSSEVPGETEGDGIDDAAEALLRRLNGARAAERIGSVVRDAMLDRIARAHAAAMMKAHLLGHDVGDGDPTTRVAAASSVAWKLIGENVAKAKTERAAHRALYASPSHRANMLDAKFTRVGVGVVVDAKTGDLWVAQLYGG